MQETYLKAKIGFKWTITSNVIRGILGFLTLLLTARILSISEMGLISIITVVYGIIETFAQFGISQSIISREKTNNPELTSIFWINMLIGFSAFIFLNLTNAIISNFYSQPNLVPLLRLLSIIFLIEPIDLVFRAVLQKELMFRALEKINMAKSFITFVVTTTLLFLDFGVLGYVFGLIAGVILSAFALLVFFYKNHLWLPTFTISSSQIRQHYQFGFYVTMKQLINYAGKNFDELIVGKLFGLETLGLYYFSKKIIERTARVFNASLSSVTFPFCAKLKNNIAKLKKAYTRLLYITIAFALGFLGIILVTASHAVPVFFGLEWLESVNLVKIFSLIVIFDLIANVFCTAILYIFDKQKYLFHLDLVLIPFFLIAIFPASLISIESVAIILVVISVFRVLLMQKYVNELLLFNTFEYLKIFSVSFQNLIVSVSISMVVVIFTRVLNSQILQLIIIAAVYVIVYSMLFLLREKGAVRLIKNLFLHS